MKFNHIFFSIFFLIISCFYLGAMPPKPNEFCPNCEVVFNDKACPICGWFCGGQGVPYFFPEEPPHLDGPGAPPSSPRGVQDESFELDVFEEFFNIIRGKEHYGQMSEEGKMNNINALVLQNGIDSNDNPLGYTFLHMAVVEGKYRIVEFLLMFGFGVNKPTISFSNGSEELKYTPLHLAVFYGFPDIVELLLRRGANVDAKDYEGHTPKVIATNCFWSRLKNILFNYKDHIAEQDRWIFDFDGPFSEREIVILNDKIYLVNETSKFRKLSNSYGKILEVLATA